MDKKKCYDLADIDPAFECDAQDNMGGIVESVTFGYHNEVATWPDYPTSSDAALSLEKAGALEGDVVMANGCKAYKFNFTDNTGSFTIKPQGETGGESFLMELTLVSARIRKKILGFLNATKGRKLFFIVEDNNGTKYLMGDSRRGAILASDSDGATTGTTATERNQTTLKFQYNTPRALVYEGDCENILTAAGA
jgi:hypothetical protein